MDGSICSDGLRRCWNLFVTGGSQEPCGGLWLLGARLSTGSLSELQQAVRVHACSGYGWNQACAFQVFLSKPRARVFLRIGES